MKYTVKYFVMICLLYLTAGCDDNNSMHQKYLDEGEIYYIGIVDSVKIFPGRERVRFSWQINADPRITGTLISWNENQGTATIPIVRRHSGIMQIDTAINIPEGIYTFTLANVDDEGNQSKGVDGTTVLVYGPKYIGNLQNRPVQSVVFHDGAMIIRWASIDNMQMLHTTVRYMDYTDAEHPSSKTLVIENSETETEISNVRTGDVFSVASAYQPEKGIDSVEALPIEYTVPPES
ncbi:MAG: DUF4998 domain-containing protein [Prevotellaceae bacterium]|nr:DUF4998 domain-containing protein [Prevotellaceae bacterium]